jgi:phage terminase Nu1 subunit (DNA packaging protein)
MTAAAPATDERRWLLELLDSADSADDLQAIEDLLEAEERKQHSTRWECRTLAEVAEFFGLAVQTVKQWRTESPPMPGTEGRYPLQQIVAWRLAKATGNASTTSEEKRQAEIEQIRLQSEKRRIENAKKRGELIERVEIERDMALLWSRLVSRLQSLPEKLARLAPDAAKAETLRLATNEIDIARREFCDSLEDLV